VPNNQAEQPQLMPETGSMLFPCTAKELGEAANQIKNQSSFNQSIGGSQGMTADQDKNRRKNPVRSFMQ
jgi:hypothetical protein